MFRNILLALILIIGLAVAYLFSGETNANSYIVTPDTFTVTIARPRLVSRKDIVFVNTDPTYILYIASYPITLSLIEGGLGALAIMPKETYHDNFHVYKSTWYVTASTDAITGALSILEKE